MKCDCECSCIPKSKVCDGINDCCGKFTAKNFWCIDTAKNSIDEQNCPTSCQDGKFNNVLDTVRFSLLFSFGLDLIPS